jgi:hypothetical protein
VGTRLQYHSGQKKEQELHEAGIPDPLEGCMLRMRNRIWGRSRIDDNG